MNQVMQKIRPTVTPDSAKSDGQCRNGVAKDHRPEGPKKLKLEWVDSEQFQVWVREQEDSYRNEPREY